jgi:glycosyltransferase involved in cell wall biosynthesis
VKVLHVFNALEFSGAEVMYVQAASLFQESGCELIALSTANHLGGYADNFKEKGYQIEHQPLTLSLKTVFSFIQSLIWIFKFIKTEKIDVVHIHRSSHFWWVALAAKLAGAGGVRTIHNVFKNRWFTRPKAIIERWSARVILGITFHTIGESVYQNEKKYYKNITVKVNNWFDSKTFSPAVNLEEKQKIRNELGLGNALVVISVGGCSYVKRHEDIIEAVSIISKSKNIIYLHLGDGVNCKDERTQSAKLNLTNNIVFVGNTNEVRKYLIASDIYLMPSRFEGLSISTVEAMACGLPMVLYNVPGLKDLIHDNDTGMLINENVDSLVNAINYLEDNPEIKEKMSSKALLSANNDYGISNGVNGIINIYNSVSK